MSAPISWEAIVVRHNVHSTPAPAFPAAVLAVAACSPASPPSSKLDGTGDVLLLAAWMKLKEALEYSESLNAKIYPAMDAPLSDLPPLPDRPIIEAMTEEQRQNFNSERAVDYFTAFDKHGVTPLQREQADLLEHVIAPLAGFIREATPTTLAGAVAIACFLRECDQAVSIWVRNVEKLDVGEASLQGFIDHLAALASH